MSTEKKTLPTTPGWYARASEPLTEISTIWVLDDCGKWWFEQWVMTEEAMLDEAPLARLVMETELADRIDVDAFAELLSGFMSREASLAEITSAAEHVLLEIKQGRMNK